MSEALTPQQRIALGWAASIIGENLQPPNSVTTETRMYEGDRFRFGHRSPRYEQGLLVHQGRFSSRFYSLSTARGEGPNGLLKHTPRTPDWFRFQHDLSTLASAVLPTMQNRLVVDAAGASREPMFKAALQAVLTEQQLQSLWPDEHLAPLALPTVLTPAEVAFEGRLSGVLL